MRVLLLLLCFLSLTVNAAPVGKVWQDSEFETCHHPVQRIESRCMIGLYPPGWSVGVLPAESARAFPGAEGLAALTRGAADPVCDGTRSVVAVTNNNDSGAGSLRDALEGSGKDCRFVIFKTSGIINLSTTLNTTTDNHTILGQTSPSGIVIAGANFRFRNTNNTIIRHIRSRLGAHSTVPAEDRESLTLYGTRNMMIDKSSFSWAGDEVIGLTSYSRAFQNVTFSRVLVSEAYHSDTQAGEDGSHAMGMLVNGNYDTGNTFDMHKSVFVSMNDRVPEIANNITANLVNNVAYNYDGSLAPRLDRYEYPPSSGNWGALQINYISNMTKAGPESNNGQDHGGAGMREVFSYFRGTPIEVLYMNNNYGENRRTDAHAEWDVSYTFNGGEIQSTAWRRSTPFPLSGGVPITAIALNETNYVSVRDQIVAAAGATRPVQDDVDTRIKNDYTNGTGVIIATAQSPFPGDYGAFGNDPYPTDTDNDGMADSWETANGLNVGVDDALLDLDGDGYLNIEEYSHYLAGDI